MRKGLIAPTALIGALVLYSLVNPLRTEHLAMLGAATGFWFMSRMTRHFVLSFVPFCLFVWMYDLLRIFADTAAAKATVAGVHQLELLLFGWTFNDGTRLTLNEIFATAHHQVIDVIGGLWYASHVGVIILLGVYLWWRHQRKGSEDEPSGVMLHRFLWGFLVLNIGMFTINLLFPVAPPWYITEYGYMPASVDVIGNPAALARLDQFLGIEYFATVYSKSAYVYGAMPSGHTAYAVWFALHMRGTGFRMAGWFYAGVMGFFAVYLNHHYLLDVMAGTTLAVSVYFLFRSTPLRRIPCAVQKLLRNRFLQADPVLAQVRGL
ncbi:MAG: inositol phosphorylceramide synthase [Bradymonadaceae bacterium]|nr:inositol phosphorylceramide synthase [Lujinxingiaceae bacterium]